MMASAEPPQSMKALILIRPDIDAPPILSFVEDQPVPTPPPGHLLVRIHASAIHPSDLLNCQGSFSSTTFPRTPGRDFSGTVIAVGPHPAATTGSGDAFQHQQLLSKDVFGTSGRTHAFTDNGFHAQYAVVPADAVAVKPDNLTYAQAATLGVPFTTAGLTLECARAAAGETVLVLGANGTVGRAAVLLAKARGCTVLEAARGGKSQAGSIDTAADPELTEIVHLTAGRGVDVVIDTVGHADLTGAAVKRLGKGGRLAFVAGTGQLMFEMREFYRMGKSIVGCNSVDESIEDMGKRLREMVSGDAFTALSREEVRESVWQKVGLDEAVSAYELAVEDKKRKFVIIM